MGTLKIQNYFQVGVEVEAWQLGHEMQWPLLALDLKESLLFLINIFHCEERAKRMQLALCLH